MLFANLLNDHGYRMETFLPSLLAHGAVGRLLLVFLEQTLVRQVNVVPPALVVW